MSDKEFSEKYLEIVRHGNMDNMFDFGCQAERERVLGIIEEMIVEIKREMRLLDQRDEMPHELDEPISLGNAMEDKIKALADLKKKLETEG